LNPKGRKTDHGENCIVMNFMACILYLIIVRVFKSRRMRWVGHIAHIVEGRGVCEVWLGGPKGRDHWEDLGVGGRIVLK
jgi:hypothetical protein